MMKMQEILLKSAMTKSCLPVSDCTVNRHA